MIDITKKQSDKKCLSSYAFDHAQLFGNSLKSGEHLLECPQCRSQHDEALALDEEFLEKVFTQTLPSITQQILIEQQKSVASLHLRNSVQERSRSKWGLAFGAAAATALILIGTSALRLKHQSLNSESVDLPDLSYIGDKGAENELEIYCKRNNKVFRVHNKMTLFRDDQIRFVPVFPKAEPHYVMAVSLDSMGNVSKYFPLDTDSAVLVNNDKLPLPGSIILDDVLGPERVWMLFSETPFDFQTVKQVVQSEWERTGSPEKIEHLPLRQNQSGLIFFKGEEP